VEKMIGQVRRAGYELGITQLRRQDSSNAAGPLAAAEVRYNQEEYNDAILGYIDLIGRYPNSTQVSSAVEGIRKSVQALEEQAQTRGTLTSGDGALAALQSDIAGLEASLEEKDREVRDLRARLDAQSGDSTALERSIEEKNREIAALKEEIERTRSTAGASASDLEEKINSLTDELESKVALTENLQTEKRAMEEEIASLNSQIEQMEAEQAAMLGNLEEEMQKKINRLENVERRYNKLVDNYQEYARQEDALVAAQGERGLVQSKLHLNTFLSASEESFPGLWDRIKRYDEAFEKAGRTSAAEDLSDILFELSVRDRTESRDLFLESEKTRYRDVPAMVDLIDDLRVLVRE
jgi:chromosome segregation ATPase